MGRACCYLFQVGGKVSGPGLGVKKGSEEEVQERKVGLKLSKLSNEW